MSMFGRVMTPLGAMIVGATLAACGGGSTMHDQQASPGIAVGEPNPAALATAPFVEMARTAACSETKNRLFVIDGKQVFWDHAGRCADASYEQVLFGNKPEARLCSYGDTIAGPKTNCQDESARALFETIVKHADQPDLGLGSSHKVEQLAFLPAAGTAVTFDTVAKDTFSGVTAPQTVVIKDQAAWDKLWAQHTAGRTPVPAQPKVDFTRKMLLAVFAGDYASGCRSMVVGRVAAGASKLEVEIDERDVTTVAICLPVVTQPMQVVAVDRWMPTSRSTRWPPRTSCSRPRMRRACRASTTHARSSSRTRLPGPACGTNTRRAAPGLPSISRRRWSSASSWAAAPTAAIRLPSTASCARATGSSCVRCARCRDRTSCAPCT